MKIDPDTSPQIFRTRRGGKKRSEKASQKKNEEYTKDQNNPGHLNSNPGTMPSKL